MNIIRQHNGIVEALQDFTDAHDIADSTVIAMLSSRCSEPVAVSPTQKPDQVSKKVVDVSSRPVQKPRPDAEEGRRRTVAF